MPDKEHKTGWLAQRREKQRLKRERTGDSPQKQAERTTGPESTVKDAASGAGVRGAAGGGMSMG